MMVFLPSDNRKRGGFRGNNGNNSSDEEGRRRRKVRFEEQRPTDGAMARGTGRGGQGGAAPRGPAASTKSTKRGGFAQQIANHIQRQPSGRPKVTSTGNHANYEERYNMLKDSREHERAAAIANKTLADPNKRVTLAEAITPVGTCPDMCPEYERMRRAHQRDIQIEEKDDSKPDKGVMSRIPDENKMVKKFQRSAAGQEEQLPSDLRHPSVLKRTLDYLFDNVIGNASRLAKVHHFVWDRTRAIRNDFSIQQVSKSEDVKLAMDTYERIARFHIVSLHLLSESANSYHEYTPQQEREQLDKTILSLLDYYEDNKSRVRSPNEPEFRAYQILFQIQSPTPDLEDRLQNWPQKIRQDPRVQSAMRIYTAACSIADLQGPLKSYTPHNIAQGHWGSFWTLVTSSEVSYLMGCVAEIYFPTIRFMALRSLWQTYRPRGNRAPSADWTLDELRPVLGLQTEDEVADYCEKHGFTINDGDNGTAVIDLASALSGPADVNSNPTCTKFVESKREGRALPAVMNGMNVQQAREAGLQQETDSKQGVERQQTTAAQENENDKSLFVTGNSDGEEDDMPKAKPPQQHWGTSGGFLASTNNAIPSLQQGSAFGTQNKTWSPDCGIKFAGQSSDVPFGQTATSSNPPLVPHQPAQPTFAPSNPSMTSPFGFPPSPAPAADAGGEVPTTGDASRSLFDRISGTHKVGATAPAVSKPSSFQPPAAPMRFFGSSTLSPSTSHFGQPAPQVSNTTSPFGAQTSQSNFSQQPFESAGQQATSKTEPFTFTSNPSNQQPAPFGFNNASNQTTSNNPAPSRLPQTKESPSEESLAKLAAEQKAKADERKRIQEETRKRQEAEQREAEEQERRAQELAAHVIAERKAEQAKTFDELARRLLLGPQGFLNHYIAFHVEPLIKETQKQVQQDNIIKEADEFRLKHIMHRYGRKWRDICWKRRLARQGRERRKRQHKEAELRQKRERERNITAELDAFRNSIGHGQPLLAASTAQPKPSQHRLMGNLTSSSAPGLTIPQLGEFEIDRRPKRLHTSQQSDESGNPRRYTNTPPLSTRSEGLRSSQSPMNSSARLDNPKARRDTTRSNYFRLKAMGIQPSPDSLPPAKPASAYRPHGTGLKRLRESESYLDLRGSTSASPVPAARLDPETDSLRSSMPPPQKRPAREVEVEKNLNGSTSTTNSLNQQDEDEAFLEAVRQARKAMSDSIDFFREEMEGMKRESARTSRSGSVERHPSSVERARRQLDEFSRSRARDDINAASTRSDSTSSRRAPVPPPKYRDRPSKFLRREDYADMKMQREGSAMSPRMASGTSAPIHAPRRYQEPEQDIPPATQETLQRLEDQRTQTSERAAAERTTRTLPQQTFSPPQQAKQAVFPASREVNGTPAHPLSDLAPFESRMPNPAFVPGASLSSLIDNSTQPTTKPTGTPIPASNPFTASLPPKQSGTTIKYSSFTSVSTSFVSESSHLQPASSFSARPETPQFAFQFAPTNSSPSTTPKAATPLNPNPYADLKRIRQGQQAFAKPVLPSSSPVSETGTQRHERLQALGVNGANGFGKNATPISPPKLKKRTSAVLDEENTPSSTIEKSNGFAPQKSPKRQKRNPNVNQFALLADEADDDGKDEGEKGDGSQDGLDVGGDGQHELEDDIADQNEHEPAQEPVAQPFANGQTFTEAEPPTTEAEPTTSEADFDGEDNFEIADPTPHGQNGDYGTSSVGSDENEEDEDELEDEKEEGEGAAPEEEDSDFSHGSDFAMDKNRREYREWLKTHNKYGNELYPEEEQSDEDSELEVEDEDDIEDDFEDEDEETVAERKTDFNGKSGASVEDAIEL